MREDDVLRLGDRAVRWRGRGGRRIRADGLSQLTSQCLHRRSRHVPYSLSSNLMLSSVRTTSTLELAVMTRKCESTRQSQQGN